MAKLVNAPRKPLKSGKKTSSVTTKRVKGPDGKTLTVRTINADSRTFGDDLTYLFRQNVKKARRENKRLVGSADRVPAKA